MFYFVYGFNSYPFLRFISITNLERVGFIELIHYVLTSV